MVIDSYSFGCMVIDGKQYTKDLMILPDGSIFHPWWRKTGHTLAMPDLQGAIATTPDILVVGTGNPGLMKPEGDLSLQLFDMSGRQVRKVSVTSEQVVLHGLGAGLYIYRLYEMEHAIYSGVAYLSSYK